MKYFWVMTLRWNEGGTSVTNTANATTWISPGMTRSAVYHKVLTDAREAIGVPSGQPFNVLFYCLDPDDFSERSTL